MKKVLLTLTLVLAFAAAASAQQPTTALVQAAIDAYNGGNAAYFDKVLADDVVWLDEDGHAIAGKQRVSGFVGRQIRSGGRKLTVNEIKINAIGDMAWAYFAYTIEAEGKKPVKGLNSVVYKKAGTDWQIVLVHGSMNAPSPNHP